jgi:hypothetical protein
MLPRDLALISVRAVATTYSFQTTKEGFRSWALCTVNDRTGELLITSDWGSWSHRWDARPDSLGAPSLTAFIGDRGDVDYLARKLQREGRAGRVFSAPTTARALRERLCERRLEDGRCQLENRLDPEDMPGARCYTEDGLPIYSHRHVSRWMGSEQGRLPYLTREEARRLWEEVGDLADELGKGEQAAALFYERLPSIEGFSDYVTEEPWEYGQTEQTPEDRALRDIILPALIAACRDQAAKRSKEADHAGDVKTIDRLTHEAKKRKKWDAAGHDRGGTCKEGSYESADYVDGWNEALALIGEPLADQLAEAQAEVAALRAAADPSAVCQPQNQAAPRDLRREVSQPRVAPSLEALLARYRETHAAFHRCWARAIGTPLYNEVDWIVVNNALSDLARAVAEAMGHRGALLSPEAQVGEVATRECPEPSICDDLTVFVDGELEIRRAVAFRAHLPTCEACQRGLVESMQLSARLSTQERPAR